MTQLEREREIKKKSVLDFKFKGRFGLFCEGFSDGMYLSINITTSWFFHETDKRIPIICSSPGLAATLIDWTKDCISNSGPVYTSPFQTETKLFCSVFKRIFVHTYCFRVAFARPHYNAKSREKPLGSVCQPFCILMVLWSKKTAGLPRCKNL